MPDRYHYYHPTTHEQYDNLVRLGRWLVITNDAILVAGGPAFGEEMPHWRGLPADVTALAALPPLAYGPIAGIAALPGETWAGYCDRAFAIRDGDMFHPWLNARGWAETDPSPTGVALRIAYALDYGVPGDHAEVANGLADTDYDTDGFMWDRLDLLPTNIDERIHDFIPLRRRGPGLR